MKSWSEVRGESRGDSCRFVPLPILWRLRGRQRTAPVKYSCGTYKTQMHSELPGLSRPLRLCCCALFCTCLHLSYSAVAEGHGWAAGRCFKSREIDKGKGIVQASHGTPLPVAWEHLTSAWGAGTHRLARGFLQQGTEWASLPRQWSNGYLHQGQICSFSLSPPNLERCDAEIKVSFIPQMHLISLWPCEVLNWL